MLDGNVAIVDELDRLPERAGRHSVEANLVNALTHLAQLRDDILPLELAFLTQPDLAEYRRTRLAPPQGGAPASPIAAYLRAEQELGRVRHDLDCDRAAVVLLITLFGIGLATQADTAPVDKPLLRFAIHTFVTGICAVGD